MWRKEEARASSAPEISTTPEQTKSAPSREAPALAPLSSRATACISQGIKIRGEITGNEDVFIDGEIDGRLDLSSASLTVGPNGRIKADIFAREVIVRGRVNGKVSGKERVQVWSTGNIAGEVNAERLAIEDGGIIRGKVEAGKRNEKPSDAFKPAKPQEQKKAEPLAVPAASATVNP